MMSYKQSKGKTKVQKIKKKTANSISIPIHLSFQLQENINNSFLTGEPLIGHVPGCSSGADINLILDVCLKGNVLKK